MKHMRLLVIIAALIIAAIVVVIKVPMKRGLDIAGGIRIVYQADMSKITGSQNQRDVLNSAVRIIRERSLGALKVAEPLVQPKGKDQIVVELPDIKAADKEKAIADLGSTAQMEFRHLYNVHFASAQRWRSSAAKYTMASERNVQTGRDEYTFTDADGNVVPNSVILEESKLILSGDDLKPSSKANKDPSSFETVVQLEFTPAGRKKFADFTRKNVNEILAIVLDGKILSAPSINEPILNGSAQITGNFSTQEAQTLGEFINAGALPVPLSIAQVQSVEATLGQASVVKSIKAGLVGLALVIVFMLVYYLLPGLLADIALAIYALLSLAVFALMGVTMTLPGIAAFILSVGMAVDANILIFERLKEELRNGKTLRAAIDTGFSRAFTSIFDSNMCTLISCIILFNFGTGPIKGFAVILSIGVIISMFTAITVTRTLLHFLVTAGFAQNPMLYGLGRQWVTGKGGTKQVDIVGRMAIWFVISAVVLLPGLYYFFTGGLKLGIDFKGGSLMQVEFSQTNTDRAQIEEVLTTAGLSESQIQQSKDNKKDFFIRTKAISSEQQYVTVKEGFESMGGKVLQRETVGAVISKELTQNAVKAVLIASLLIVLYLSLRFAVGGIAMGFRFGVCAILATLHDVGVIIGIFSILGYFAHWEIDSLFVTAVLTVIGFSTHDTIVIFDRIRENLRHRTKGDSFDALVNRSILQSFGRSINTSLTVVLTLAAMVALGAGNIRHFTVALLVGVVTGTYSSIFNASQLLVLWQRMTDRASAPAATAKAMVDVPLIKTEKPSGVKPPMDEEIRGEAEPGGEAEAVAKAKTAKKRKRRF